MTVKASGTGALACPAGDWLAGFGAVSTGPDFMTLSGAAAFPVAVAGADVVLVSVVMA
ncbi:MAG: hypothetical protein ACXIVE_03055 [Salinarimonas sp.]